MLSVSITSACSTEENIVDPCLDCCEFDEDCSLGQICQGATEQTEGICVTPHYCTGDTDCSAGEYCGAQDICESYCCDPLVDDSCAPENECQVCSNPFSCEDDETCSDNGYCVPNIDPCFQYDDEQSCLDKADCVASYTGLDCTDPNGTPCDASQSDCTCDRFVFAQCMTAP